LEKRESELLDVPYFHAVFTLPKPVAAIAYQNKEQVSQLQNCTGARNYQV
jgi:hypothetical protein